MAQAANKTFTATSTGALATISAPGGAPFATYAILVKGTDGSLTSWTVNLEGSLNGVDWTTICTHNSTAGSTVWDTNGKACTSVRANVSALTLNTATSVTVIVVAVP
jgi:hypothetical protein